MTLKNFSSGGEYGFWDQAGRNLFWKLPNVTFINVTDEKYFKAKGVAKDSASLISEKDYMEANREGVVNLYVSAPGKSAYEVSRELTNSLLGLTMRHARLKQSQTKECSIATLSTEIIIGVDSNPEKYLFNLLNYLTADKSLSIYTPIRPQNTPPD